MTSEIFQATRSGAAYAAELRCKIYTNLAREARKLHQPSHEAAADKQVKRKRNDFTSDRGERLHEQGGPGKVKM